MGPYFFAALGLACLVANVLSQSDIHPSIGIPIIILLSAAGGILAAKCDYDRDHHNNRR